MAYIGGMLGEDPSDEDTREFVCEILIEALLSQFDIDRAVVCDSIFALLDEIGRQYQQISNTNKQAAKRSTERAQEERAPKTNIRPKIKKTHTPPKDMNKKKKQQQQATPPKTKTTHKIKRPIIKVEEVQQYMLHLQNNPDLDEFPMNNSTIQTQIAECEVAYYKIRHTNPVLAEVDMEFYHSLPPVQVLLREMTRLESLTMQLEANNITTTTNITTTMTATRPQPKTPTATYTISTTEYNNNNNKAKDINRKVNDDKHIAEQAWETKRQHKQAIEREQAWHQKNNKIMRFKISKREIEEEKERETARR